MIRFIRALGAAVILAAVVLGAPVLLWLVGNPLALVSTNWSTALLRPDDGSLLLGILSLIGWVAWLFVLLAFFSEATALLSRRRIDVTIPGTGWLRSLLGSLIAAAVIVPSTAASAAPVSPPVSIQVNGMEVAPDSVDHAQSPEHRVYNVQQADELWSIAETHLGGGERWRDIVKLNPELDAASRLQAGQALRLPPDVQVRTGDTLWDLAKEHLGDGRRWTEIFELNSQLIDDPDQLQVGWRLELPTQERDSHTSSTPVHPTVEAAPEPSASESTSTESPDSGIEWSEPPPSMPQTPDASGDMQQSNASSDDDHQVSPAVERVLGPMGGLLAGALFLGISTRRRLQLIGRAVGQRLVPLSPDSTRFWAALAHRAGVESLPPMAPTSTVLGWDDDGDVILEIESRKHLSLDGDVAESALASIFTTLISAPWATDVEVVLVEDPLGWSDALDDPRVTQLADRRQAIESLTRLCAERRMQIGTDDIQQLRTQPDRAPAFAPVVYLFAKQLGSDELEEITKALQLGDTGISVVTLHSKQRHRVTLSEGKAHYENRTFTPQLVEAPARRALVELFTSTLTEETESAPWWRDGMPAREQPASETTDCQAPRLVLLGEPELHYAAGVPPTRARARCVEYCAWLLENPGSTSTKMAQQLFVAESTRRSNMSRLRKWLGSDSNGNEYLPDAYSGRIGLDKRVTSDWEEFKALLSAGIINSSEKTLRESLTKVKGPILGSAGSDWPWAAPLKEEMEAMVVDAACELADRSMANAQNEQARWALEVANHAAPNHDAVELRLIRVHRTAADQAFADEAIAKFRSRLRVENRELNREHLKELDAHKVVKI